MITESEFEHIAEELRPRLMKVGMQFFSDQSKAEDVAQEVLMRLWVMRHRLVPDADVVPLAVRIAKNICVSVWRHEQLGKEIFAERLAGQDLPETPLSVASTDDSLEEADNEAALNRAMRQLTDHERQLISMRNEQQMDISDIAEITGASKRSVSTMINRAKNKLMKIIKKGDDDNGQY